LKEGTVIEVGGDGVSCLVLFHRTRREDFLHKRVWSLASGSRRVLHPVDLGILGQVMGIKPGDIVLEVGTGHGQFTVVLSDLVNQSGRVISVSKDKKTTQVAEHVIADWLKRNGDEEEEEDGDRISNVSLHSFDLFDQEAVKRGLYRALSSTPRVSQMVFDSDDEDDHHDSTTTLCEIDHDGLCYNSLDAVAVVKLPRSKAIQSIIGVLPFLKSGGCVGVVPLHLDDIQALDDAIHETRLPLYLESIQEPTTHRVHDHLEMALHGVTSAQEQVESKVQAQENSSDEDWKDKPWYKKSYGYPKALKWPKFWPIGRMTWATRKYHPVWIVKLMKVGDHAFVKEAEKGKNEHIESLCYTYTVKDETRE
jgi:SAM-dependent methyltransferase